MSTLPFVNCSKETSLTLTRDDLTLLSRNPVRVSLREGKHHLVYVFSAFVQVPFVTAHLRTLLRLRKLLLPSRPSIMKVHTSFQK
jgi:hypothetical protein